MNSVTPKHSLNLGVSYGSVTKSIIHTLSSEKSYVATKVALGIIFATGYLTLTIPLLDTTIWTLSSISAGITGLPQFQKALSQIYNDFTPTDKEQKALSKTIFSPLYDNAVLGLFKKAFNRKVTKKLELFINKTVSVVTSSKTVSITFLATGILSTIGAIYLMHQNKAVRDFDQLLCRATSIGNLILPIRYFLYSNSEQPILTSGALLSIIFNSNCTLAVNNASMHSTS